MKIAIQKSMMPDEVPDHILGDVRDKILLLYESKPEIATSDRVLLLAFWDVYDDLGVVLGDKIVAFTRWWFTKATTSESIRRSRQSLTEHGLLPKAEQIEDRREWLEDVWHRYWGKYR